MIIGKLERRIIKRVMKCKEPAKQIVSLLEDTRVRWDDDNMYCREYGFVDPEDASDKEIDEWLHDTFERHVHWPAQWDCSGQLFTISIRWHRNPNGYVSFIHSMGVDV